MTIAFVDFPAQKQQQMKTSQEVLNRTHLLIEALKDNFRQYAIRGHQRFLNDDDTQEYHQRKIDELKSGKCDIDYTIETGKKYHKVIFVNSGGSCSVHCFIDKNTGDLFKSATSKAPAKGIRFNLLNEDHMEWLLENADWSGGYTYAR